MSTRRSHRYYTGAVFFCQSFVPIEHIAQEKTSPFVNYSILTNVPIGYIIKTQREHTTPTNQRRIDMKNAFYQVVYWTEETSLAGNKVDTLHETRVAANDEIDAECIVADRHPDGYGFWAIASKDVSNFPNVPHSITWSGSY